MATFELLLVISGGVRSGRGPQIPFAAGAYIDGAYRFTSSTSLANPAVTIARKLSDTFAGIAPGSVPPFVAAQLAGALLAVAAYAGCIRRSRRWPPIHTVRYARYRGATSE